MGDEFKVGDLVHLVSPSDNFKAEFPGIVKRLTEGGKVVVEYPCQCGCQSQQSGTYSAHRLVKVGGAKYEADFSLLGAGYHVHQFWATDPDDAKSKVEGLVNESLQDFSGHTLAYYLLGGGKFTEEQKKSIVTTYIKEVK